MNNPFDKFYYDLMSLEIPVLLVDKDFNVLYSGTPEPALAKWCRNKSLEIKLKEEQKMLKYDNGNDRNLYPTKEEEKSFWEEVFEEACGNVENNYTYLKDEENN